MNRKRKNIILFLILIVSLCGIIFTMFYAKDNLSSKSNPGEMVERNGNMGEPPEKPDGNNGMGEPPEKPDGDNNTSSSNSLTTGYYISFIGFSLIIGLDIMYLIMSKANKKTFKETLSSCGNIIIYFLGSVLFTTIIALGSVNITNKCFISSGSSGQANNGPSGGSTNVSYKGAKEITSSTTIDSEDFSSTNEDENALLVSGDIIVNINNSTVTKTGNSDGGDSTSFYGMNSAILAKDGAVLNLSNINVTTDANGANGVFSYGGSATNNNSNSDGTTINISDSKIVTTGNNAGGIMTTGGGITNAYNLDITTNGTSSAAIRSDRGGGEVLVSGGIYTTNGQGSPAIYSTADISVSDAELIATASEGVVIEGANSVNLYSCTLTDTNNKLNGQSTTYKNIFLYQSMSGDAKNGKASFSANSSTITTNKGDTLYVTNTTASITLENNTIINNDTEGNFLRVQKDSWGNSGSNGGDVTLKLINQKVTGNIVIDSISKLNMLIGDDSYYEGEINSLNEAKEINLKIDSSSKFKLTGNSYVTSLSDEDKTYSNIDFNGYQLFVNGVSIN